MNLLIKKIAANKHSGIVLRIICNICKIKLKLSYFSYIYISYHMYITWNCVTFYHSTTVLGGDYMRRAGLVSARQHFQLVSKLNPSFNRNLSCLFFTLHEVKCKRASTDCRAGSFSITEPAQLTEPARLM